MAINFVISRVKLYISIGNSMISSDIWHKYPGFSIEGGTRRLIAAYFGIYSRLLCV